MRNPGYKENTNDLRNSLSLKLIKELQDYKFKCRVHDPMHYPNIHETHHIKLEAFDALQHLSVIILTVDHDAYRDMGLKQILQRCKPPYIVMDIPNLFVDEYKNIEDLIYWNL